MILLFKANKIILSKLFRIFWNKFGIIKNPRRSGTSMQLFLLKKVKAEKNEGENLQLFR